MRACLVLCVAAAIVGAARAECTACIEGSCYQKHPLSVTGISGWPIDIDRNRNILYTADGNTLKQCQLDTKQCNTTTFTWNIEWLTVDQGTGNIYGRLDNFTDSYNLCKLNLVDNDNEFLVRDGVYYMTFKDKLYYSPAYEKGIYTYEDGESRIVTGTEEFNIFTFVVDKKDDIYFQIESNETNFLRRLSNGVVDQSVYWEDNYEVTTDKDGNAVFIHEESHVVYRAAEGQLVEVGAIKDSIYHDYWFEVPLFDKDDSIIYRNNRDEYFYLKRDEHISCTYSISQNTTVITETAKTK